jgi:hypothetical protein
LQKLGKSELSGVCQEHTKATKADNILVLILPLPVLTFGIQKLAFTRLASRGGHR